MKVGNDWSTAEDQGEEEANTPNSGQENCDAGCFGEHGVTKYTSIEEENAAFGARNRNRRSGLDDEFKLSRLCDWPHFFFIFA